MEIYTVSYFGHRLINDIRSVEQHLEPIIEYLITTKEYVDFLIGRNGDFDQLVASVIHRLRRRLGGSNSSLIWVMPYETADYRNNAEYYEQYYDEIEICRSSANGHYKSAYQERNRRMVDRSDLIIFYVEHLSGGAYHTLKYARKTSKAHINLSE